MELFDNIVNVLKASNYSYITFVAILVGVYLISKIVVFIITKVLLRIAKKTKTKGDDLIIEQTQSSVVGLIVMAGIRIAVNVLDIPEKVLFVVNGAIDTILIFLVLRIIVKVIDILITEWGGNWAKKTKSTIDDELLPLMHRTSNVIFVILGIIFVLKRWSIDVTGILAGMGIAGLAISFAVKDSLANIFGGISLILDKSVKVGDIIKLDSGDSGKIMNIGLRSTKIKNWDGEALIVPNSIMANTKLINVTQPDLSIKISILFAVKYGSDPEIVKELAQKIIMNIEGVSKTQDVVVWFTEMGDFSLNFKAMFWVDDISDKWTVHQKCISALYKELNRKKIGIPFPTQTIHLEKNK